MTGLGSLGSGLLLILLGLQGYQWLKYKVQSEEGKKQQAKVMDLLPIAHQLGCTVAQLAIGETLTGLDPAGTLPAPETPPSPRLFVPRRTLFLRRSLFPICSLFLLLWPQRGVSAVRVSARSCWGC